jgi:hypothetical protein
MDLVIGCTKTLLPLVTATVLLTTTCGDAVVDVQNLPEFAVTGNYTLAFVNDVQIPLNGFDRCNELPLAGPTCDIDRGFLFLFLANEDGMFFVSVEEGDLLSGQRSRNLLDIWGTYSVRNNRILYKSFEDTFRGSVLGGELCASVPFARGDGRTVTFVVGEVEFIFCNDDPGLASAIASNDRF